MLATRHRRCVQRAPFLNRRQSAKTIRTFSCTLVSTPPWSVAPQCYKSG
jgi:hypothetical protein